MLVGSAFHKGILYLFQLAWECRFRLPLLITVGFMVLDVRMQLEINIDVDQRNAEEEFDSDEEYTDTPSDSGDSETDDLSTSEGRAAETDETDETAVIPSKG